MQWGKGRSLTLDMLKTFYMYIFNKLRLFVKFSANCNYTHLIHGCMDPRESASKWYLDRSAIFAYITAETPNACQ